MNGASRCNAQPFWCRFLVLRLEEIEAIALWILHTYAIEANLNFSAARRDERRETMRKDPAPGIVVNLVFRHSPPPISRAAALFRAIERCKPTLLLDEADTFLHHNDELKGIINSGYRRSSFLCRPERRRRL